MCRSIEDGGQRCAAHTRPRFEAATPGTAEWDAAAAEYAATRQGSTILAEIASAAAKDGDVDAEVAARTALERGRELAEVARRTRETVRAQNRLHTPVDCPRCRGRGIVERRPTHGGVPGGCFQCGATGLVEGDRATLAEAKRVREGRRRLYGWIIEQGERHGLSRARACDLADVLTVIEDEEPERLPRMVTSLEQNRPDLFRAIVVHAAESGLVRYGATRLSPEDALRRMGMD